MRLLLDTHVLLWVLEDSPRLSRRARAWVADPANECWVSAASLWEIAIKARLGRLELASPLASIERTVADSGLAALDVTLGHAAGVGRAEATRGDPFDRLLMSHPVALAA